jgi:hypothetical protein
MTTIFSSSGLTIPTRAEILEEIVAAFKSSFGDTCRVDDVDGVLGRIAGILADMKDDVLSELAATVGALLPSTSYGVFLEELMKFNGITKNVASKSTVTVTITANDAGCSVYEGDLVGTVTGVQFELDSDLVVGPGLSDDVTATAVEEGALAAPSGTIDQILTPRYGWASVTNDNDATIGNAVESDPAARLRRWQAASAVGLHHPSAIKKAISDLDNVTDCLVEVNHSSITNENGVPPQHVRVIVVGGDSDEIGQTLFGPGAGSIGAGIGTWGDQSVAVSAEGQPDTIRFDRGTPINIFVIVRTHKGSGYPIDGDDRIKAAVLDFAAGDLEIVVDDETVSVDPFHLGDDVVASRLFTPCNAVPGHSVRDVFIGIVANPTTDDDIAIANNEYAYFDIDNIDVQESG